MIVGIDGGKPPKLKLATRTLDGWHVAQAPFPSVALLAAAEKPEGIIREHRTPASVISPAGWGMAGLFAQPAETRVWLPTEFWKTKLRLGPWNTPKVVFCNQIVTYFRLEGLNPRDDSDQDDIDAIGIAIAASRMTEKEIKKYAVSFKESPVRYIPARHRP